MKSLLYLIQEYDVCPTEETRLEIIRNLEHRLIHSKDTHMFPIYRKLIKQYKEKS